MTEIMDQYGVDISVASLQQTEYFKSLGKTWNELTEAEKKQLRYNKILEDTAKVQGNAEREAEGFGVQVQLLKTNVDEMVKTLGEMLIPVLEPLIAKIGEIVSKLKDWIDNNPELASAILIITGVIGGLLGVVGSLLVPIGSLVTIMGALTPAIASAGGIMAFLSASILPVIATIGGLIGVAIALFMAIKSNWEGIKEATNNLIETCRPYFEQLKESFSNLWDTCKSIYDTIIAPLFQIIGEIIEECINFAAPLLNLLMTTFSTVFNTISTVWNTIGKPVFNFIMSIVQSVWGVVQPIFNNISSLFSNIVSAISSVWNNIGAPIFNSIMAIVRKVADAVAPAFNTFRNVITSAMNAVLSPIQFVIDKLSSLFGWISDLGGKIGSFVSNLNPFKNLFGRSMEIGVETDEVDMPALNGSYYTADTVKSRNYSRQATQSIPINSNFNNDNSSSNLINILANILQQNNSQLIAAISGLQISANDIYLDNQKVGRAVSSVVDRQLGKNSTRKVW